MDVNPLRDARFTGIGAEEAQCGAGTCTLGSWIAEDLKPFANGINAKMVTRAVELFPTGEPNQAGEVQA